MSSVENEVLHKLFMSKFITTEKTPVAVREVLETLIQTTLDYRDHMLAKKGRIITVHDVRVSLAWLIPCLATGNMPEIGDPVRRGLIERWLEALGNPSYGIQSHPQE